MLRLALLLGLLAAPLAAQETVVTGVSTENIALNATFDGSDLFEVFRENWGYIHEEGIAPILLGEFGSKLATEVDRTWAEAITSYLSGDFDGDGAVNPGAQPISFAWWSWNPNSGDTGGVLADDWRTPRPEVLDLLEPFLDDAGTPGPASRLVFTVSLEEALAIFAQPRRRGARKVVEPLRELGADPVSGGTITLREGRFGLYVTDGDTNASLRKEDDPGTLTPERAQELLQLRREATPEHPSQ